VLAGSQGRVSDSLMRTWPDPCGLSVVSGAMRLGSEARSGAGTPQRTGPGRSRGVGIRGRRSRKGHHRRARARCGPPRQGRPHRSRVRAAEGATSRRELSVGRVTSRNQWFADLPAAAARSCTSSRRASARCCATSRATTSCKEIALCLGISAKTVEAHVSAMLRKLRLYSRHELSRWAVHRGWLE
jgi:DNA-binding CsgD family transcriptional regulator